VECTFDVQISDILLGLTFRPFIAVTVKLSSTGFFKSTFSQVKCTKHGFTSLLIAGHDPPSDITIFMDIQPNPGPSSVISTNNEQLTTNEQNQTNLMTKRITYSKNELFSYRCNATKQSPELFSSFSSIKHLDIFRYRGTRGGRCKTLTDHSKSHSSSNCTIHNQISNQ